MNSPGRLVVLGSVNEDLVTRTPHLPVPGETLVATDSARLGGGKGANQAVAAARMGADVVLVGAVGDDEAGRRLTAALASEGIDVSGLEVVAGSPTGTALVSLADDGENCIIVVPGANAQVGARQVARLQQLLRPGDVLLAQLELPPATVLAGLALARAAGASTVLNAAPMAATEGLSADVDVLVVNETEAEALAQQLLGSDARGVPDASAQRLAQLLSKASGSSVVITLGGAGAVARVGDQDLTAHGLQVDVVDTTGAGDTFVGVLVARLSQGVDMASALPLANAAAAAACTAVGAQSAMPYQGDTVPGSAVASSS